jgi:hypothetical protein
MKKRNLRCDRKLYKVKKKKQSTENKIEEKRAEERRVYDMRLGTRDD